MWWSAVTAKPCAAVKKRGPGRGRGVPTVVTAGEQLAESAGKQGFFGRMMSRAGGLLSAAGNRMGLGRFAGLFRGAGRLGGGALWAGAMAAPVLLDNSASAADKAGAMGSLAGSIAGGALGGCRRSGRGCHWLHGGQLSR